MYQTLGTLVPSCCQIRSGCPSPFKSPIATILQPGCGPLRVVVLRRVLPSVPPMYQTLSTLVPSSYPRRSGHSSPFKSPVATILQPGCGLLRVLVLRRVLPSAPPMYQTAGTLVPSCCQNRLQQTASPEPPPSTIPPVPERGIAYPELDAPIVSVMPIEVAAAPAAMTKFTMATL